MLSMRRLLSSKEIIRILKQNEFTFVSQKGSHKKFKKDKRVVMAIKMAIIDIKNALRGWSSCKSNFP